MTGLARVVATCVGLAALSLFAPWALTYDPWAWLIWGREIGHFTLNTNYGPSWKPLPVLFTTLYGLVPSAAPALWVLTARAAGLASIALAFRVARRLGGGVAGGLVAAACVALITDYGRFAANGYSEGLLAAFLLTGIELHLVGRRRAALTVGFCACLLRPEAWPFAGLYALWLARRDPAVRRAVPALVVLGGVLWFGAELWGSGDAFRAGSRAHTPNPNSLAFSDHPAWEVLKRAVSLLPWPARIGFVALPVATRRLRLPDGSRARALEVLALAAVAWVAIVAAMTEGGFSGNTRYLMAPLALVGVAAGATWGLVAARLLPGRGRVATAAALGLALVTSIGSITNLNKAGGAIHSESRLMHALDVAIHRAGGPRAILRCGQPTIGPFHVPALAWRLDVSFSRVSSAPAGKDIVPRYPGTVWRATPGYAGPPRATPINIDDPRFRPIATAGPWQVLAACGR